MTKLDYSKLSEPDPGRVIEVRESGVWSGNDSRPFETKSQSRARRTRQNAALLARSEAIRYKAIIKKFGEQRAIEIGVPPSFIEAQHIAKERAQRRRQRRAAKRAARCL